MIRRVGARARVRRSCAICREIARRFPSAKRFNPRSGRSGAPVQRRACRGKICLTLSGQTFGVGISIVHERAKAQFFQCGCVARPEQAFLRGRAGTMRAISVEAARAGLVQPALADLGQRRIVRRLAAVLAGFLFLASPGLANAAATGDAPTAARTGSDPGFHSLFVDWQRADRPRQAPAGIPSGQPVDSTNLTSGFGIRSDPFRARAAMHPGIDLAGPIGTPVYATADGIVDRSEWNNGGYGNLIEIDHGQGIQTRYGHLSQRIAQPGQRVHRGDLIGLMGSTGRSTGSHLHYEVRIAGSAVNPIPFVPNGAMMVAMRERRDNLAEGGPRSGSR
jgi:murein DD-endopeptidase MepM/ murein hydrolase activator NlpD